MNEEFSKLEIQLIRSSLATKTDDEIAELLERPVDKVRAVINEITDGQGETRSEDVVKHKQEKEQELLAKKKRIRTVKTKIVDPHLENKKKMREKESVSRRVYEANINAAKSRQEQNRKFKTLEVDLSKMISVKIDEKTTVFVSEQQLEEFRQKTGGNRKAFYDSVVQQYHKNQLPRQVLPIGIHIKKNKVNETQTIADPGLHN